MGRENGSTIGVEKITGRSGRKEVCVHHWIVKTPNGQTSRGDCKKCHTVRYFFNALGDILAKDVTCGPFPYPDGQKAKFRAGNKLAYVKGKSKSTLDQSNAIAADAIIDPQVVPDNAV